jgi:4-diphosphocytidyl-2-C-methyl-D-erythritol kinase
MHLHRSNGVVTVLAPAKLNLFFEVLGKRADGYHEIETLVTPVSLYDTLSCQEAPDERVTLACRVIPGLRGAAGVWVEDLPLDHRNLVVRAVELLRNVAGVKSGLRLALTKRIPTAAGLGGGSSDAAAALWGANAVWNLGLSMAELSALGAKIGSDVPLFFARGSVLCRGRGERIEPFSDLGALHFVIVRPPIGLSTAAVYQACRPAIKAKRVEPFLDALRRGNLGEVGRLLFNRLECAAETLSPWICRLREAFHREDCLGAQMSGSGSCYFGLCRHAQQARRIARSLQAKGLGIAMAVRGNY